MTASKLSPEAESFREALHRSVTAYFGSNYEREWYAQYVRRFEDTAARLFDERTRLLQDLKTDAGLAMLVTFRGWPLPEEVEALKRERDEARKRVEELEFQIECDLRDPGHANCRNAETQIEAAHDATIKGWEAARREVERLRAALAHAEEWMSEDGCDCGTDEPGTCGLCVARAALTPSTVDPEPQPAEVNRDELHDLAGQVMALFVPSCPECCTPETDGDLCDPCAGKIADIERLLSRGAR